MNQIRVGLAALIALAILYLLGLLIPAVVVVAVIAVAWVLGDMILSLFGKGSDPGW